MDNIVAKLTWQTIQQVIDNQKQKNNQLWFWQQQTMLVDQLQELVMQQQQGQDLDNFLDNHQLFNVAEILVRNYRSDHQNKESNVNPLISAFGQDRIKIFYRLYQSAFRFDWLSNGLLTRCNFEKICQHTEPQRLSFLIDWLYHHGLLQGFNAHTNFDAVSKHSNLLSLTKAITRLNDSALFYNINTQDNLSAIINHQDPHGVVLALDQLNDTGLLQGHQAQANFDAVAAPESRPQSILYALNQLHANDMLQGSNSQTNFNLVIDHVHRNPHDQANIFDKAENINIFKQLSNLGLLKGQKAQANLAVLAKHHAPQKVSRALSQLMRNGVLKPNNIQRQFDRLTTSDNLQLPSNIDMATLDNARKLKLDNNDNNQSTCNHHLTETVKNNGLLNDNCQPQNNQFVKSQQLSSYWKNDNQTATTKPTNKNYENSEEKNQKFKTEKTTFSEYEESRTLSTTNTTYRHLAKASSNDEPTDSPNWSKAWPSSKINGLKRESVAADGNCLFHALAMHTTFNSQELRNVIANYLEKNINRFANWLVTAPQDYIKKIRHDQTWGGEIEITAAMELLQRPIYVIQHESKLIPYVPNNTSKDDQPIFLHYTGSHYDGYHIQQGYSAQNIVAQLNEQFGQDIPRSLKNDCLHYMSLFASEKETEQTINAITSSSCNSLTQQ